MCLFSCTLRRNLPLSSLSLYTIRVCFPKETHPLYLQFYLNPECLVLPSLLPCYSLDFLGWRPLNQCFLLYFIFLSSSLTRFPHHLHSFSGLCCARSPLLHQHHPVPAPAPVPVPILRSFAHLHLRSPSISVPVPINVHVPIPAAGSVPVSVSAPDFDPPPAPVRSSLSNGLTYPLGTMCVYRQRALRAELSGDRKRRHRLQGWSRMGKEIA